MGVIQDFIGDSLKLPTSEGQVLWLVDTITSPGTVSCRVYNPILNQVYTYSVNNVPVTPTYISETDKYEITITDPESELRVEIDNGPDYVEGSDYGYVEFFEYVYEEGNGLGRSETYIFNEDFYPNEYNETWEITKIRGGDVFGIISSQLVCTLDGIDDFSYIGSVFERDSIENVYLEIKFDSSITDVGHYYNITLYSKDLSKYMFYWLAPHRFITENVLSPGIYQIKLTDFIPNSEYESVLSDIGMIEINAYYQN